METALVPQNITPSEIFIPKGLDPVIDGVKKKVKDFQAKDLPLEKKKNRDEIISFAAKIAKSKVFIDKSRIQFVKEKKEALKVIDAEGKRFRDTLDGLRDEVRQPVTDWEDAEKARIEEERQLEIFNIEHEEALAQNELVDRERAIEEKEAELARQEEERKEKAEAERLAKEQTEREERLKKEAADKAKKEAEEKIQFEKSEKERIEREAKEAKAQAERDRIAVEERAKIEKEQAEQARIEAAIQAEIDKQNAIKKAQEDAEAATQAERERVAAEVAEQKAIADKKAANKRHQAAVNNQILANLEIIGVDQETGKKIIITTVRGEIPGLAVLY